MGAATAAMFHQEEEGSGDSVSGAGISSKAFCFVLLCGVGEI